MNIALERAEEQVGGRVMHRYGDTFIRGNNGASRTNAYMIVGMLIRLQCCTYQRQRRCRRAWGTWQIRIANVHCDDLDVCLPVQAGYLRECTASKT